MLNLVKRSNLDVKIVQRCSGHGGIWGTKIENFDKAMKVGKPAINQALLHQRQKKGINSLAI
jgi:glycerol-3-phosphate dehydrogenase subunit C